ncbi:putative amidase [Metarhizium brunneum]
MAWGGSKECDKGPVQMWVYLPVSYRPFLVRPGDVTYIAIPHVVVSLRFPKTPSITSDIYSTSTRAPELRNGGRNLRCIGLASRRAQACDRRLYQSGFFSGDTLKGNAQDSQRVQDAWPTLSPNPVTGSSAPSQVLLVATPERDTPNTSYFLGPGLQLYQAWRMYPDIQGSFATSLFPSRNGSHEFYPLDAAYNPLYYDGYHEFDDFRNEYEKRFGKPVYVGPYMRKRGAEVTKEMKDKSLEDAEIYRRPVAAFTWNYIASVHGLPQLVSPTYESRVTRRIEQLPFVGIIIGVPGSDLRFVNLVKNALERANRPTVVLTGRSMFTDHKMNY